MERKVLILRHFHTIYLGMALWIAPCRSPAVDGRPKIAPLGAIQRDQWGWIADLVPGARIDRDPRLND